MLEGTRPYARLGDHYIKKKVVIVDDSRSIRGWLRVILAQDPRLEVVGEADSAKTAREVIKRTEPDVITLDIEMPGMSGLVFLEKLMKLRPMPVVMISGATKSNSEATITALSLGAVDCILKPTSAADEVTCRDITRRVFSAACSKVQKVRKHAPSPLQRINTPARKTPIVLIGASTGGVGALETVLADLPEDGPPVVIVQHMPGAFLVSFTQMLNRELHQDVAIAKKLETLTYGQVRLAPAVGMETGVKRDSGNWHCYFSSPASNALHCPSVDTLFRSAYPYGDDVIAVLLTGLGRDGASAMLQLRGAGAQTICQDQATSVVYGMPKAAWELGAAMSKLPLQDIGSAIARAVEAHAMSTGRGQL